MTRLHPALILTPYALAFALAAWALPHMPEKLPTHWGPSGEPDAWGSAAWALFQMPVLLLPGSLMMLGISQAEAGHKNNGMLNLMALGLGLLALIDTAGLVFSWDTVKTLLIGLGLLFTLIGNHLGRAQPSAFVGLRTPWVYLSRRAWHASQRRSGVWLTIYGLSLLLPGLLLPRPLLVPMLYPVWITAGMLLLVGGLTYASYSDYKRDPDPQPVDLRPHAKS